MIGYIKAMKAVANRIECAMGVNGDLNWIKNLYKAPRNEADHHKDMPSLTFYPPVGVDEPHPRMYFRPLVTVQIDLKVDRDEGLYNDNETGVYDRVEQLMESLRHDDDGKYDPYFDKTSTMPATISLQDPVVSDLSITISLLITLRGKTYGPKD